MSHTYEVRPRFDGHSGAAPVMPGAGPGMGPGAMPGYAPGYAPGHVPGTPAMAPAAPYGAAGMVAGGMVAGVMQAAPPRSFWREHSVALIVGAIVVLAALCGFLYFASRRNKNPSHEEAPGGSPEEVNAEELQRLRDQRRLARGGGQPPGPQNRGAEPPPRPQPARAAPPSEQPAQGRAAPQQGRAAPQQGRAVPQQGRAAPQQGRAPQAGQAAPAAAPRPAGRINMSHRGPAPAAEAAAPPRESANGGPDNATETFMDSLRDEVEAAGTSTDDMFV